jgi:hypothetical protein
MRRGLVVALLVCGATVAVAPAPAAAASQPSKCLTDNASWRGRSILPELKQLGVRVWMTSLQWESVARARPFDATNPSDPAYHWPPTLERSLRQALARGIEPVLFVNTTPSWANGGRSHEWAPTDPWDFADFMTAAVRRYPEVRRWQIIAEPSRSANFKPQGDRGRAAPRRYAKLLDAAYEGMHTARPDVVVIGGNLHPTGSDSQQATSPVTFLRNMKLPDGRRPRMDLFGINPYSERRPRLADPLVGKRVDFNDLDWLTKALDRAYPGRKMRIFIGEFGWQTEHGNTQWFWFVPRRQQAADLTAAYRAAARLGRVDTFCWFTLHDAPPSREQEFGFYTNWTSGLKTHTGKRKASWEAFRRVPPGPRRDR